MFKSVIHMLFETIDQYRHRDALRFKRDGRIQAYSYEQFGQMISKLAHGLSALGLQKNDKIAILSNNRPEWTISDFAVFGMQGVVVPIYQTLPASQIAYILNDSESRGIFVENEVQYAKVQEIKEKVPSLEFIIMYDQDTSDDQRVHGWDSVLEKGQEHLQSHPNFLHESMAAINPEDVCSFVYTSGTTGDPKGVMLHHKGFVTDIVNAEAVLNLKETDVFLSFLPLSHLYERLAGHWCPMYRGGAIHYAQSIDTVVEDIAEAKPTVMVSVPRLYEKIAARVQEQVENGPALKRNLFYWAIGTGLQYHEDRQAGKVSKWQEMQYKIADRLVFYKIKQKLGGRFRYPIAGGAPLSVETLRFFEAVGLPIVEGYGMTETHLIITLTPAGQTRYGSCGKPIEGVQLQIAEDGEVLIKGDILMKGYFKKPELTDEVIDQEGWLHTGDIGYLDDNNFLFLTDRKKNIIVTSGGKNVAPAPLEHKIKKSKYIDDVCLVGDKRKFISALIIPNWEILQKWARDNAVEADDNQTLAGNDRVKELIWQEIETQNKDFARYEQVKNFTILGQPLSIEKGELTPSLKIKRNVVEKNYKSIIDDIYKEN
ncbi:MAG: AMP-binding protein [Caldithrix sp.]|nr:AMP-binding protein [Caldithrix sp.]